MTDRYRARVVSARPWGFDVGDPAVEQLADRVPAFLAVAAAVDLGDQLGGGSLGVSLGALDVAADVAIAPGLRVTAEGYPHLPAVRSPAAMLPRTRRALRLVRVCPNWLPSAVEFWDEFGMVDRTSPPSGGASDCSSRASAMLDCVSELDASTGAPVEVVSESSFGFNNPDAIASDGTGRLDGQPVR